MKSNYIKVKKGCTKLGYVISPVIYATMESPTMFDLLTNSKGDIIGKVKVWDSNKKFKGFVHIKY